MLKELRLIEDEIQSNLHYLKRGATEQEQEIFGEMLEIAQCEKDQINIILTDYLELNISLDGIANLLKV